MLLKIRFKYVALILLLVLTGVALYFYKNQKAALKFVLPEVEKITLLKATIKKDTVYLEVFVLAENNSPYKLNIDSAYCEFFLDGKRLMKEALAIDLEQEKDQRDTIRIPVRVPLSYTRKTIEDLQKQDSTGLTFKARVVYNTVFGKKSLSVNKDKQIAVPVPPVFKVLATQSHDLRLLKKDVKTDLYLLVKNDGKNVDLNIEDLQYKLTIGDQLDTKGKFGRDVNIRPHTKQVLKFPIDFYMHRPFQTVFKVLTDTDREPFHLELSGYLNLEKMKRVPTVIFAEGYLEMRNEEKVKAQKKKEKEKRKKKN